MVKVVACYVPPVEVLWRTPPKSLNPTKNLPRPSFQHSRFSLNLFNVLSFNSTTRSFWTWDRVEAKLCIGHCHQLSERNVCFHTRVGQHCPGLLWRQRRSGRLIFSLPQYLLPPPFFLAILYARTGNWPGMLIHELLYSKNKPNRLWQRWVLPRLQNVWSPRTPSDLPATSSLSKIPMLG